MHPILFEIGPIKIFTYGFLLALGFLSAIFVAGREARRLGIPPGNFSTSVSISLAALVGSRLLYVLLELRTFLAHPLKIFALWEGGLVFQGGVILAFLVAAFITSAATACPGAHPGRPGRGDAPGAIFRAPRLFYGRVLLGLPADLPWSVVFSNPDTLCPLREPLHPAQLYEAFLALGVFGFSYWFRTRKRFDGQLILMYFCLAGLVRFMVEFFRASTLADPRGPEIIFHMPATPVGALAIALISGACLWWGWQRSQQA